MTTQNLIIYKFTSLYHILEELDLDLNFKITCADNENYLSDTVKNLTNNLVISNKKWTSDEVLPGASDININSENIPKKIFKRLIETYGAKVSKLNEYYNEFNAGGDLIFDDFYEFDDFDHFDDFDDFDDFEDFEDFEDFDDFDDFYDFYDFDDFDDFYDFEDLGYFLN